MSFKWIRRAFLIQTYNTPNLFGFGSRVACKRRTSHSVHLRVLWVNWHCEREVNTVYSCKRAEQMVYKPKNVVLFRKAWSNYQVRKREFPNYVSAGTCLPRLLGYLQHQSCLSIYFTTTLSFRAFLCSAYYNSTSAAILLVTVQCYIAKFKHLRLSWHPLRDQPTTRVEYSGWTVTSNNSNLEIL